jgi:hypothetical protein
MKRVICLPLLLLVLLVTTSKSILLATTSKVAAQPSYKCYKGASVCCEISGGICDGTLSKGEQWNIQYQSGSGSASPYGTGRCCETDIFGPTPCWPKFNVATVSEISSKSDGYEWTRARWEKVVINQSADIFCGCQDSTSRTFFDERTCSVQVPIDQ